VTAFSFVAAYIIGTIIDKTMGFRCSEEEEITGIDLSIHAESAYELASFTGAGYSSAAVKKERVDA
jgi:Amt family ammonium transporter